MSFSTLEFYIFFLIVFLIYSLLNHRQQNIFLLAASYIFYAYWDWRFISLLFFSTVTDYWCSLKIEGQQNIRKKKKYLQLSLATNLTLLGIFKYANFFIKELNDAFTAFGMDVSALDLHIILPLGISFYTFQTLGYTIDVYRGQIKPTRNFLDYALFVSFFPQLIAGPIERADHFLPQIKNRRKVTWPNFKVGIYLIYWGLFKKIFIADNCGRIADTILSNPEASGGGTILVALYALAFQLYGDISGYTDIARGTAKCMGFDLTINFRLPYFAKNISEFWRKWHMSMTYWFRDYVYFPVFVKSKGNAYVSSCVTLLCISVWHSLSFNSIARGIYYGIMISLYHVYKRKLSLFKMAAKNPLPKTVTTLISWFVTFHVVCVGWLLFYDVNINDILVLLRNVFFDFRLNSFVSDFCNLFYYLWILVLVQIFQAVKKDEFIIFKMNIFFRLILYWLMFWAIFGGSGVMKKPFIYFGF